MSSPSLTREQAEALIKSGLLDKQTQTILQNEGVLPSRFSVAIDAIITNDKKMLEVKRKIKILHPRSEAIMILGETGTGKELIARALHGNRTGDFVSINCSGLPDELLESELFGHVQGAFTGAYKTRIGKFEQAKDGTLFLDEIGDMPMNMQAKLLRALQFKIIIPLGSNEEKKVNVRFVCATHQDLGRKVEKGEFRRDLLYRLNAFILHTTPLRMRKDDIAEALDAIYDKEGHIPQEMRDKFCELPLLGNYRELESRAIRYLVFNEFDESIF